jgi:hypothetical protein
MELCPEEKFPLALYNPHSWPRVLHEREGKVTVICITRGYCTATLDHYSAILHPYWLPVIQYKDLINKESIDEIAEVAALALIESNKLKMSALKLLLSAEISS